MKLLLVAATRSEIEPFLSQFNLENDVFDLAGLETNILITGVGMTSTAYHLGKIFASSQFDLVVNAGIAGAFDRSLQIGEPVVVKFDSFAELGAEDDEDFISIDMLGFGKSNVKPEQLFDHPAIGSLKKVSSISVNKVHGNDESIYKTVSRLNPQTESMEGAAFYYACNQAQLPCVQLRTISNYVERRNKPSWNIPLAIKNLNDTLTHLITELP